VVLPEEHLSAVDILGRPLLFFFLGPHLRKQLFRLPADPSGALGISPASNQPGADSPAPASLV
jgi:hypothetical protein